MAEGLSLEELNNWVRGAAPQAPPDHSWMGEAIQGDDPANVRARGIIRDIYARHNIPLGTPLANAMDEIESRAQEEGIAPTSSVQFAWNNPEERAAAREEYAAKGGTWGERNRRWQESKYLLPPDGQRYLQNYGRDADFLESVAMAGVRDSGNLRDLSGTETLALMSRGMAAADVPSYKPFQDGEGASLRNFNVGEAIRYWDASNNSPLYRKNWAEGTYKSTGGLGNAVANVTSNPDLLTGSIGEALEAGVPARIRHGVRNPNEPAGDNARGEYRMRTENRPQLPVAILDIPSGATPAEKSSRIGRLVNEFRAVSAPRIQEGVYARTGVNIGDMLGAVGDGLISAADGTQVLAPAIGFMLGGRGTVGGAVKGVLGDTATDFATSAGLSAGAHSDADRTWSQWALPSFERPTGMMSDQENRAGAATRQKQARQYEKSGASGVSTADADAYSRLVRRSGDMIPQGPRYR